MKKVFSLLITAFIAVASFAKPDFTIPQIEKYANADECRKDNDIALKTANFYLDAELPADIYESRLATKYMLIWVEASDEILFALDSKRGPYLQCKDKDISIQLMAAYLAGSIIYCLENKQKDHNFDMHYFALSKMMTYYEKNRSITGSDKDMDKLLKEFKSSKFKAKEEKKFKK